MEKRMSRAEVPVDQTWDLGDLFASHAVWSAEIEAIENGLPLVTRFAARLGESPATMRDCLDARERLTERLRRAGTYASLCNGADGTNTENQANLGRVTALYSKVEAAMSFIDTEILGLPDGTVERFMREDAGVASHKVDLDDLLDIKPHMLSAETEQVLASLGEVMESPYRIYNRSKASDIRFAPFTDGSGAVHENSFNLYEWVYESNADPVIRRNAWKSFCEGLKAYNNTYAATISTEISKQVVLARLRGYASVEHYLLKPHKVPFELYTNVVQVIQEELAPHMRRYAHLRKRVLGLDKLLYCDIKAPLDPAFDPRVTYEEASEMILESVACLGEEYQSFIRTAQTQRWVDRADNVGKSSGAFCASPYGAHPFILVTWTGSMRDAFVLAHELGHAGHFGLAMKNQRMINLRPGMPFVEMPSTMNETLLARHILARSKDQKMRRWVIMQTLGTYHHNFVTHLLEAQLQRELYALAGQGEAITASVLNRHKAAILSKFWGDSVEIDEGAAMTWMRQPHYYLGLYPYTYSVGLAASTALAVLVNEEGPAATERWVRVLKAGGTLKPLDLMKEAGIDMSSPEPIRKAVAYVGSLIDELEQSFET